MLTMLTLADLKLCLLLQTGESWHEPVGSSHVQLHVRLGVSIWGEHSLYVWEPSNQTETPGWVTRVCAFLCVFGVCSHPFTTITQSSQDCGSVPTPIYPDDMSCLHSDGFIQTQKLAPRFDPCFKNTRQQQRQRPTVEALVTWWTLVNVSLSLFCLEKWNKMVPWVVMEGKKTPHSFELKEGSSPTSSYLLLPAVSVFTIRSSGYYCFDGALCVSCRKCITKGCSWGWGMTKFAFFSKNRSISLHSICRSCDTEQNIVMR